METYDIPLIIRGKIIEENLVTFTARRDRVCFRTPDVKQYVDKLVLRNPIELEDLYSLSVNDIIDYLGALGERLTLKNFHIQKALEINTQTGLHSAEMLQWMYAAMPKSLSRLGLEEIVDQVFGRACLDGWEHRNLSDREVMVRAFGSRTVHLNAGNGPPIVMFGLIYGSLLRNDNIVKSPSNDPYTAAAVALTMIEMAPDHPITKHLSVAYWKGGDVDFEEQFYKPTNVEKIVAWGGFASMKSIRKYLRPGMDLIALDPKLSASLLGNEAFESEEKVRYAAHLIARDVGVANQGACVSTRIVYCESGTSKKGIADLNRLGKLIFEEIQTLPASLSSPHPAFEPVLREEIDGIRYSEDFEVIGGLKNEGAVIISQISEPVEFADQLDCRVVNLVPVDRIEDALTWLTIDTQTIAVFPEELKKSIAAKCAFRGGQRLTSLGCTGFQGLAYPQDSIELGRRMARWVVIENFDERVVKQGAGFVESAF